MTLPKPLDGYRKTAALMVGSTIQIQRRRGLMMTELCDHVESLTRERDALREALKPFADWAEFVLPMAKRYEDHYVWHEEDNGAEEDNAVHITLGALRAARAALSDAAGREGGE